MCIYDFEVLDYRDEKVKLGDFKDKVMLIVNTASKCGFTPQLGELEKLSQKYKDDGLVVIAFPCNQFGAQDPGTNLEIQKFYTENYGVTFPIMAKIQVNGKNTAPIYEYLKKEKSGLFGPEIKWNFTKYLINRNGNVIGRYAFSDNMQKVEEAIEINL